MLRQYGALIQKGFQLGHGYGVVAVVPQPAQLSGKILRKGDDIVAFQRAVGISGKQMVIHQHRHRLSRGDRGGGFYLVMAGLTAGKHQQAEHQDRENAAA